MTMAWAPGPDTFIAECDSCRKKRRLFEIGQYGRFCLPCLQTLLRDVIQRKKEGNDAAT